MFSELGTVDEPSLLTGSPSNSHMSFPTKKTGIRTELEEGERGRWDAQDNSGINNQRR